MRDISARARLRVGHVPPREDQLVRPTVPIEWCDPSLPAVVGSALEGATRRPPTRTARCAFPHSSRCKNPWAPRHQHADESARRGPCGSAQRRSQCVPLAAAIAQHCITERRRVRTRGFVRHGRPHSGCCNALLRSAVLCDAAPRFPCLPPGCCPRSPRRGAQAAPAPLPDRCVLRDHGGAPAVVPLASADVQRRVWAGAAGRLVPQSRGMKPVRSTPE